MADSACEPQLAPRRTAWAVAALVLAGGLVPVAVYGLLFGRIATVTPDEAKAILQEQGEAAALVDVRPPERFAAGHIDGAVSWALADIRAAGSSQDVPDRLRGKTLLLVCDVGMASRLAAWRLGRAGVEPVYNVRGGIQEWIRSTAEKCGPAPRLPGRGDESNLCEAPSGPLRGKLDLSPFPTDPPRGGPWDRWRTGPDQVGELPFRVSPVGEQAAAVLAFFVFKPIYTLLSLLVAVVLWRSRDPDLVALRWGMIAFFLGENACAINYFLFRETSYTFEYLHSFGMLVSFGFVAFAVLDGLDRRLLGLSDPAKRCAALGLCGACIKYAPVPCGLRRTFYVIIPALLAVTLMLPLADWQDASYNTWVFGRLYNYAHLRVYQQLENWYCAAAAAVMFAASLAALIWSKNGVAWAKVFLAAGLGPLGFGALRMVLGSAYDQNRVWYLFWEEGTELLFILGVCAVLWIFRQGLGLAGDARRESRLAAPGIPG